MSVYTEQHTNLKCFTLGHSLCHGVGIRYIGMLEICAHPFEGSWHLELSMMAEPAAGQGAPPAGQREGTRFLIRSLCAKKNGLMWPNMCVAGLRTESRRLKIQNII